jgi:hypothetical protein
MSIKKLGHCEKVLLRQQSNPELVPRPRDRHARPLPGLAMTFYHKLKTARKQYFFPDFSLLL